MYGNTHKIADNNETAMKEERQRDTFQITEVERRAVWNATQHNHLQSICVPQLVEAYAAAAPDSIAVVASGQSLSYRDLNRRANQLAYHLQMLGVQANVPVGLCIERSLDMVVGMLGILKAGGAYLPLECTFPSERLAFLLEDAQVQILVTKQHLIARSPTIQVVYLDCMTPALAELPEKNPVPTASANDLAYVIYTSGSTGQPKGVQVTHANLLNLVFWHQRAFEVKASDRATQLTSPAFDATVWELWPYLTAGASVYLPDDEIRVTPLHLRDWLIDCGITITFLPTPLAESVMLLEWPQTTSLRFLLTGADRLFHYPPAMLPFPLINNYGPTETTVVATSGHVLPTTGFDELPSIGRPIDNTEIYLLDRDLRQVPVGVAGELYIGGDGLSRGYLNRPELTAEKFIAHPFSTQPGARLYKTGDLARFLSDGQIAFLGRIDDQIKIRGYRIEPGEIVSVLNEHPAVQASLVVAREDVPGEKLLVAYVVLAPEEQVSIDFLHEKLKMYLPDYMIPAAFVQLEALPLTSNGKIDRAALPAPTAENTLSSETLTLPVTPAEKQLANIIAPLLGLEPQQMGIDNNFFLFGGSSLLGTQVITRVNEVFGIDLPQLTLFEAPTIRLLACSIEELILAELEAMNEDEIKPIVHEP